MRSAPSPLQAVLGGEGPLLRLGLQAAQVHHPGGQLQHEPVEAEHHRVSGKSDVTQRLWSEILKNKTGRLMHPSSGGLPKAQVPLLMMSYSHTSM